MSRRAGWIRGALLPILVSSGCTDLPTAQGGKTLLDLHVIVHDQLLVGDTALITVEAQDPTGGLVVSPPVQWNLAPEGYEPRVTVVRSTSDSLWVRVDAPGTLGISVEVPRGDPYFSGATVLQEAETRYGPIEVRWEGVGFDTLLTARGPFSVPVSVVDYRGRAPEHGYVEILSRPGWIQLWTGDAAPGVPMIVEGSGVDTLIVTHTACAWACADTLVVRVEPVPVVVQFPPEGIRATSLGQEVSLYAYVLDANGYVIDDAPLEWRLVDPADSVVVALTDPTGRAVARGNGEALFAVTHAGLEALGYVGVYQEVDLFTLSSVRPLIVGIGARDTVRVDAWDAQRNPIELTPARGVTWSSEASDVAVIAEPGLAESVVETVGFGETQIRVSLQVCFAGGNCALDERVQFMRVIPEPDSVRIVSDYHTTIQGLGPTGAHFFGDVFIPGETIARANIDWASLNPTVATIDDTGMVIAHAAGTADLVGRMGAAMDTVTVTIIP